MTRELLLAILDAIIWTALLVATIALGVLILGVVLAVAAQFSPQGYLAAAAVIGVYIAGLAWIVRCRVA